MKKVNLRIEIETSGSIFSRYLELEGKKVDINYDSGKDVHFANLPGYEVVGSLDIYFRCKGINGATSKLSIFIIGSNNPIGVLSCTVQKGIGTINESIDIP
jgi:hypothetical protein